MIDLLEAATQLAAMADRMPPEPPVSLTGIVIDAMADPRVNNDKLQRLLRCAVLAALGQQLPD